MTAAGRGARAGRVAAALGVLLLCGCLSGAAPAPVPGVAVLDAPWPEITEQDVAYTDGQTLDVYARTPGTGARGGPAEAAAPVVVMVAGCCGDRADLGLMPAAVARAGAVVVAADWAALHPGARYARSYGQVACAVAWARANAARFGGDPARVTLFGWSDGALAAAVVAAGAPWPDPGCRVPARGATPDGLVGVAGFYGWPLPVPAAFTADRVVAWVGGTPARRPADWRRATAYGWLAATGPPCTTLLAGSTDPLVADARRYAAALRGSGHPARLVVVPPAGDQTLMSPRTAEGVTVVDETVAAARRCRAPG